MFTRMEDASSESRVNTSAIFRMAEGKVDYCLKIEQKMKARFEKVGSQKNVVTIGDYWFPGKQD